MDAKILASGGTSEPLVHRTVEEGAGLWPPGLPQVSSAPVQGTASPTEGSGQQPGSPFRPGPWETLSTSRSLTETAWPWTTSRVPRGRPRRSSPPSVPPGLNARADWMVGTTTQQADDPSSISREWSGLRVRRTLRHAPRSSWLSLQLLPPHRTARAGSDGRA